MKLLGEKIAFVSFGIEKVKQLFLKKIKMNIGTFVVCSIILNFAFACGFALNVDKDFAPLVNAPVMVFMKHRKR